MWECFGSNRIYECRMYIDNNLVRNFIPCERSSDGTICLYDIINDKFYPNLGTGNFIAGPEV